LSFLGYIDSISAGKIKGWAVDTRELDKPIRVSLVVGGAQIVTSLADGYREDLVHAGYGNGRHAFEFLTNGQNQGDIAIHFEDGSAITNKPRNRGIERIHNSVAEGIPRLPVGFSSAAISPQDVVVVRELINYWRSLRGRSKSTLSPGEREMWDILVEEYHGSLVRMLDKADQAGITSYLTSLPRQRASHGILQGEQAYQDLMATSNEGRNSAALPSYDMLMSLAQYLGVRPLESPEQGSWGQAILTDPNALLADIEEILGFDLLRPTIFDGLFGLQFGGRIIEQRDIQAIYAALRATAQINIHDSSLCEIGGGLAQVAYYAWKLGVRKYTIVDLPTMSLMQYFALKRSLPEANVGLVKDGDPLPKEDGIYLVTADSFAARQHEKYDLVLNCDSFPEMGESICQEYFEAISKRSPLLLSINQEANNPLTSNVKGPRQPIVAKMLSARTEFSRVYRFRSWIRKGYAEELWRTPMARAVSPS
jgi:hypothetical protein